MDIFDQIRLLLEHEEYDLIEHEPIRDSQHAVEVTGWPLEQGAKAMLFVVDGNHQLIILRASDRVELAKIKDHFGTKKVRFAKPQEVESVMKVTIGACYPFGDLIAVDMHIDHRLKDNEFIAFSPGTHSHHIRLKKEQYFNIIDARFIDAAA